MENNQGRTRLGKKKMNDGTETEEVSPHMVEIDDKNEDFLNDSFLISFTQSQNLASTQKSKLTCMECETDNNKTTLLECECCKKAHCLECEKVKSAKPTEAEEELIKDILEKIKQSQLTNPFIWKCTGCIINYPDLKLRCETLELTLTRTLNNEEKVKKKHKKDMEKLKQKNTEENDKLKARINEIEKEKAILREQLLLNEKPEEKKNEKQEEIKNDNRKELKKSEDSKQKEADYKRKREHTTENKNPKHQQSEIKINDGLENVSDCENDPKEDEKERERRRIESCRPKDMNNMENDPTVRNDRRECENERVEAGKQCKKSHLEKKEHETGMEEVNKEKENELNTMKEKAKKQYCKHHILYNKCTFKDNCWKKHVPLEEYRKTIRCKHYEAGSCRKGRYCEYKHLINIRCKYYEEDRCMRGDTCTYRHIKKKDEDAWKTTYQGNNMLIRDDPKNVTAEESKIEPNFPKDKRKEDQITTAAQMGNTEHLEMLIETIVVKVLRNNL